MEFSIAILSGALISIFGLAFIEYKREKRRIKPWQDESSSFCRYYCSNCQPKDDTCCSECYEQKRGW